MEYRRIFLITGATSGLGLEAVKLLLQDRDTLIITGIRSAVADTGLSQLPQQQIKALPLDLGSLEKTKAFADAVKAHIGERKLSGAAFNAGLQLLGPQQLTEDGLDPTFQVNYLSHYALFDALKENLAPGAPIITTASGTHDPADKIAKMFSFRGAFFPDVGAVASGQLGAAGSTVQQGMDRYATSKLCAVLFAYGMARRHAESGLRFLALDPGLMPGTGLARERGAMERFAWSYILPALRPLMKGVSSPEISGRALAQMLASAPPQFASGAHVNHLLQPHPTSELSHNQKVQDALLDFSAKAIAP